MLLIRCRALSVIAALVFARAGAAASAAPPPLNTLSEAEKKAGWKLLFDGTTTAGWRNYRKNAVGPGWKVVDGSLTRADPGAGDIITVEQFGSFELSLEYNISKGGNSGIMFHVTEVADRPWQTGPEIQIQDNAAGHDPQKSGWLYQLYASGVDATRPAGQWNRVHLRISPELCEVQMNGVRYYQFVKGSDEWKRLVAKSKFARMEHFGTAQRGHLCLQDHGDLVAYRNIKIRELTGDTEALNPIDGTLPLEARIAFPKLQWTGWSPVTAAGRPDPLRPIVLTHAGDGTNRVFVATQQGVIHVFPNDQNAEATKVFLDLTSRVVYKDHENEEGLLGLAFHPRYKQNREFFVYYTTRDAPHTSVISRFRAAQDDPGRALLDSEEEILRIEQPFWNHNGGTICFGPDGCLYIGLGDGGSANDPLEHAQNLGTLLGSILRIDVDRRENGRNYAIPPDNPFVGKEHARPEIWAYGLRNVWRMAFDRKTGTLWAGDVGQNLWEEINIIQRGGNYGWNLREASHSFGPKGVEPRDDLIEPIWEYDHEVGKSITGGSVYRGSRLPELQGAYLYADYVTGRLWALRYDPQVGQVISNHALRGDRLPVISFGEDEEGEVYFTVVAASGRGIYRFERCEE